MQLTPHEQERLLIHVAADVAEKRRARVARFFYEDRVAPVTKAELDAAHHDHEEVEAADSKKLN